MNFGDILSLGGTIAQFIPGGQAIAPILSAGGALASGASAKRKGDKVASQVQSNADFLGGNAKTQLATLQPLLDQIYQQVASSATNFDPSTFIDPRFQQYKQKLGGSADAAVNSTMMDFADRGLGRDSSGLSNAVAMIRSNQQTQQGNQLTDLVSQGQQLQQQKLLNASQVLGGGVSNANNLLMQSNSTLGGLQGLYTSESDAFGNLLGTIGTTMGKLTPKTGVRGSKAGQATLNTNNGPTGGKLLGGMITGGNSPTMTYSGKPAPSPFRIAGGGV